MQDHRGAIEAFDAVLRVNPALAIAQGAKAREELAAGDASAAPRADDACLETSPRPRAASQTGTRASREKGSATRWRRSRGLIVIDAQAPGGYERLAEALHARGQPEESIRTALGQAWQRTPEAQRAVARERGEVALDLSLGDFAAASEGLARWESLVAASPDEWDHVEPARLRMQVALETARPREAVKIADAYDQRRAAWTPDDLREEPTIYTRQTTARALAIPPGAVAAGRAKWLADGGGAGQAAHARRGGGPPARVGLRIRGDGGDSGRRGRRRSLRCPGTRRRGARARTTPPTTRSARPSSSRGVRRTRASLSSAPLGRALGWRSRSRIRKRGFIWGAPRGDEGHRGGVRGVWEDRRGVGAARPRSVTLDAARGRASALRCPGR